MASSVQLKYIAFVCNPPPNPENNVMHLYLRELNGTSYTKMLWGLGLHSEQC